MGDEFSNIESWSIINRFYSRVFGVYNICANRVGKESFEEKRGCEECDGACAPERTKTYRFWGGSEILNPFGQPVATAKLYQPDEIHGVIEKDLLRKKKILLPYLRNDDPYFTLRELQRILDMK